MENYPAISSNTSHFLPLPHPCLGPCDGCRAGHKHAQRRHPGEGRTGAEWHDAGTGGQLDERIPVRSQVQVHRPLALCQHRTRWHLQAGAGWRCHVIDTQPGEELKAGTLNGRIENLRKLAHYRKS